MHNKHTFPKLRNKAFLSPMAGVSDVAFRTLARRYGAGLTYTEFVNSTGLMKENQSTLRQIITDPSEDPVAIQLFGHSVQDTVDAAQVVAKRFDIIDVNCGCPAWKVIKTGAGSEMLKKPEGIASFVSKLVDAVNKPITVKIRTGIDEKHINAVEVATLVEEAGASAIAIHGRTQKQGYSGVADWNSIKQVKDAVNIPVIGNGDVFTPEIFKQRIEESGVDYIMIARGAIGNPALFLQIQEYMKTGSYEKIDRLAQFQEYINLAEKYNISYSHIKMQAGSFTKGIIGGAQLRVKINSAKDIETLKSIMKI